MGQADLRLAQKEAKFVRCPTCRAEPGQTCRNYTGRACGPHATRINSAAKRLGLPEQANEGQHPREDTRSGILPGMEFLLPTEGPNPKGKPDADRR